MKRITVDLTKASTETLDLTDKLNHRVGDGQLSVPLHIIYGTDDSGNDDPVDMRDKDIEFLSQDTNKNDIYVSGTVTTNSKGDDPYNGNVTFVFPEGTFKVAGTYDVDKTMFRIINQADKAVLSTVNVKLNVLEGGSSDYNFDPNKTSYNSRLEDMIKLAQSQMKDKITNADKEAQAALTDAKQKAADIIKNASDQAQSLLDGIKQTSDEAKGNVAGDTAATAKQAKQQANDNAGKVHDLQGEVGDARGRFMTLSDRENKQDFNIDRKEDKANANSNYAAINLRDDQQDKAIAEKASQSFITDYLSRMYLQPEGFENEAALKAKYPTGKEGIFVTVDTGHKWIYANGQWNDCGVYQSAGLADRSIDSAKLKQNALPLRTTQSAPWTVDFSARKLTVTDYSFLYDDNIYQVPVGDCSLPEFDTVYIGFDAAANKLNGYAHYYDMPRNSYFIGVVDFVTSQFFMQFDCLEVQSVPNDVAQYAAKIKRQHLPAESVGLVSLAPWTVDTYGDKPTVTVNGYASYFTKNTPFTIAAGTYTFDKIESGAYYLYLDLDYKKFTATIKATSYQGNIPINDAYIGFIETNAHTYRIFENSNNLSYDFNLVTPGKFTVDFDEGILYVPIFWQTVNPLKIWSNNDSVAEIKFDKSQAALFVGIDPSQSDVQKMIVLDSNRQKIQDTYQYIGWISINTQEYDFGKYGSTHDLATQPWINKKVACLGDSITEGDSGEGGLIDSYVPKLKKYIGTTAQNFGKSGALITKKTDDDISFVNRVGAIKGQDVVTIFGGINDFQWNAPLGTMADGIDKPTTFFGALKYVITTLAATNPKAKLMLITPMKTTKFQYHTYDSNGNLMQNANGNTQLDFVNAIKQVGEYYSIPVLDMYSNSNYSPYLPSQVGHDNFTADGLHPTAHGYERIAQTIGHAINNL